jgi:hypothetical protein
MDGEAMKYGIIEFGESLSGRWNVEAKILVVDEPSIRVDMILSDFFDRLPYTPYDPQYIAVQFIVHYAWVCEDTRPFMEIPLRICQTEPWKVHWRIRVNCSQNPPKLTP